jgi:hypothetical protein
VSVDPLAITSLLSPLPLAAAAKVVHSVLDSLNRRRAPSREILLSVDGPAEADQVAEVAIRLVKQIEQEEGSSLVEMPNEAIRRHAGALLAAAQQRESSALPQVDVARAQARLDAMRKAADDIP